MNRSGQLVAAVSLLHFATAACSPDDGADTSGGQLNGTGGQGAVPEGMGGFPLGGNAGNVPIGGGGVQSSGGTAGGANGTATVDCGIAQIVSDHCTLCHASPSRYGAPMSLMTALDFQATAPTMPPVPVYSRAAELIHSQDTNQRMPPPGTIAALEPAELQTLTSWLQSGAPAQPNGCPITDPEAPSGAGGAGAGGAGAGGTVPVGGMTGMGGTGGTLAPGGAGGVGGIPTGGAGGGTVVEPAASGFHTEPYAGWDEGVTCYPFLAHNGSKMGKYAVGAARDAYVGFAFMPPWSGTKYVRAFKRVTDNAQVLHHWLFFQQSGPVQDGGISAQIGAHPDGQLMHGWAPGGSDAYLTPDIGVEMKGDTGYLLELHYNSSDASAMDASGVEICVTDQPPENVGTLSWLGTDAISGTTATGTCRPREAQRIRIIAGTPHMHLKGTHMKVVINRAAGGTEVAHDEPFSFENQRIYPEDIWLEPGDTITTTCTYNQPASFGPGTNQEMCYWFAMHYPPLALSDGALVGTLIHGQNSCLGL